MVLTVQKGAPSDAGFIDVWDAYREADEGEHTDDRDMMFELYWCDVDYIDIPDIAVRKLEWGCSHGSV